MTWGTINNEMGDGWMTDKPIIFNGDMVRALLAGRKTQTRRPFFITNPMGNKCLIVSPDESVLDHGDGEYSYLSTGAMSGPYKSPFGNVGDYLWVRETTEEDVIGSLSKTRYLADDITKGLDWWYSKKICPSIHMPRWTSRITLKITDVRVERVQEITKDDAISEGMFYTDYGKNKFGNRLPGWSFKKTESCDHCLSSPKFAFANLWNSIYNNWYNNPWVWVYEFEVINQNINDVISENSND